MLSVTCTWRYLPSRSFHPYLNLTVIEKLSVDLPGLVNNARKGTDVTDKIRIVLDRKRYRASVT